MSKTVSIESINSNTTDNSRGSIRSKKSCRTPLNISLIQAITETLLSLIEASKRKPLYKKLCKEQMKYSFYYSKEPAIKLYDYIYNIMKKTKINDSTLILGLIFLDRLTKENDVIINENTVHRLIMTSIHIAIKYNEDIYFTTSYYAKIGGSNKEEIIKMESEMLTLLNFELFVDDELFDSYNNYFDVYSQGTTQISLLVVKSIECLCI